VTIAVRDEWSDERVHRADGTKTPRNLFGDEVVTAPYSLERLALVDVTAIGCVALFTGGDDVYAKAVQLDTLRRPDHYAREWLVRFARPTICDLGALRNFAWQGDPAIGCVAGLMDEWFRLDGTTDTGVRPLGCPDGPIEEWLRTLYSIEAEGEIDAAIDCVYDRVLDLLDHQDFGGVNDLLERVDVARLGVESMLAFLTITVPAALEIAGRERYFDRVRRRVLVLRSHEDAARLLDGLA